jgi:hypothetical protein
MKQMPSLPCNARLFLMLLFLWAGVAQSDFCQNNIPANNPDAVYIDHGDGTVSDTRTGLMWKQCLEGLSGDRCQTGAELARTWGGALTLALASDFAGLISTNPPQAHSVSHHRA